MPLYPTRRACLRAAISGASVLWAGGRLRAAEVKAHADPRIRGPFPILTTPFTESGGVDYEVLARQARFVDWGGCPGMIWPQSGDSVDLLTMDEKLRGDHLTPAGLRAHKG